MFNALITIEKHKLFPSCNSSSSTKQPASPLPTPKGSWMLVVINVSVTSQYAPCWFWLLSLLRNCFCMPKQSYCPSMGRFNECFPQNGIHQGMVLNEVSPQLTVLTATGPADLYLYFNMHNRRCNQKLAPPPSCKQNSTPQSHYRVRHGNGRRERESCLNKTTAVHCILLIILCIR